MEPLTVDTLFAVGVGVGLAAAAGFRVFVPLLVLGLAARAGMVPLASGFDWISSTPAMLAFGSATVLEVFAYYIPWFDNLLDTVSTPTAMVAGAVATASVLGELPPWLQWSVAIIGGSGAAGIVAGTTSLARLKSTAFTGGTANFLVSTFELFGSVITSLLAIVLPLFALMLVGLIAFVVYRISRRAFSPRRASAGAR